MDRKDPCAEQGNLPAGVSTAEARPRFYADNFDVVEADSPYYSIPDTRATERWAERTPEKFIFNVKAYGALTGHGIDPKGLPVDLAASIPKKEREKKTIYINGPDMLKILAQRFRDVLKPLIATGKLGVVVFQFPPWFLYNKTSQDYILKCRELVQGIYIAVEFRHGSWLTPQVRASVRTFFREYRLIYVTADEPQYGNLATVPFVTRGYGVSCLFQISWKEQRQLAEESNRDLPEI